MARTWIVDLWVKDATVTLPDGTTTKISPTAAQLRTVKSIPEHFRTAKWNTGQRWRCAWYEDANGKQKQRAKLFASKREAEEFAAELEDDIRMGRYIDPSHRERPFNEASEIWLSSKTRLKDSSWRRYRRELDNYVIPKWGNTPIGSIAREHIDAWVQELSDGKAPYVFDVEKRMKRAPRKPAPLSPAYVRHIVGNTFGGVLRHALKENWIGRNPAAHVELPRSEQDDNDLPTLTYDEVEQLADAALEITGRVDDKILTHILAYSGPRIGEATALKVKDLDLDQRRARIARTWTTDRKGNRKLGPPKTWAKRWVPLPEFVVDELRELAKGKDPDDYVLTSKRGDAIDGGNWYNRVWVTMRKSTGVALGMSVHDLRHAAATLAIAAGADVKLVQQMLGHKDATETLNTYAHLWPDKVAEVIDLVSARRKKAMEDRLKDAA